MENSSSGRPKLPDDFVKKQRTYFQEIDTFELSEEAASETDRPASENQANRPCTISLERQPSVQKYTRVTSLA